MWWYGYGWWWLWVAFVVIFFLLPLGYGWGYRGWGPWYRRRVGAGGPERVRPVGVTSYGETDDVGWGWLAAALWIVFIVAIVWFIAAVV